LRESDIQMRDRDGWAPPKKIVTVFQPGRPNPFQQLMPQAEFINAGSPEAAAEHIADADAYFINVGRGETTDSDALVAALESGSIAGAGIDVAWPEPLPDGHGLWTAPNLVMSPGLVKVERTMKYEMNDFAKGVAIEVDESARDLRAMIDALSMDTTASFQSKRGTTPW
jgi:hypothetical protein